MILTKKYLKRISLRNNFREDSADRRILNENHKKYIAKSRYDIFLSHSHLDKKQIYALVNLFNKSGYSVYVDWMIDEQLDRSMVNRKTSETLRKRMDSSRCLAYVATNNSTRSKWCPWELGYMDGRTKGRCAILPILEDDEDVFRGVEYLGIYPYIDYARSNQEGSKYEFWVTDSVNENRYITLSEWLDGAKLRLH